MKTGYVSELQEIDRQLREEKQKVADLKTTLATVLVRLDRLEQT